MSKEKLTKLMKYRDSIKSRLEDAVPNKHVFRSDSYKNFLTRELKIVSKAIEAVKMNFTETK